MAEARRRFGTIVHLLLASFLRGVGGRLAELAGGPFDFVALVPSTHRPGRAPLGHVPGLGPEVVAALPTARWAPDLLQRTARPGGPPPVAHMRPDPAAFSLPPSEEATVAGARVLLLDDTYVSGARSQSAAAALTRGGARRALIVPLGRVLRPGRVALHADFLRRHSA